VKTKFTLEQATKAQEGIDLYSFLNLGARWQWVINVTLTYFRERDPVPILQQAGWDSGSACAGAVNLATPRFNLQTVLPVTSCYTDWDIPAPIWAPVHVRCLPFSALTLWKDLCLLPEIEPGYFVCILVAVSSRKWATIDKVHSGLPVQFHDLSELNYGAPGLNLSARVTWMQLWNNLLLHSQKNLQLLCSANRTPSDTKTGNWMWLIVVWNGQGLVKRSAKYLH